VKVKAVGPLSSPISDVKYVHILTRHDKFLSRHGPY